MGETDATRMGFDIMHAVIHTVTLLSSRWRQVSCCDLIKHLTQSNRYKI